MEVGGSETLNFLDLTIIKRDGRLYYNILHFVNQLSQGGF